MGGTLGWHTYMTSKNLREMRSTQLTVQLASFWSDLPQNTILNVIEGFLVGVGRSMKQPLLLCDQRHVGSPNMC